jgi:hypothetical protein
LSLGTDSRVSYLDRFQFDTENVWCTGYGSKHLTILPRGETGTAFEQAAKKRSVLVPDF